MGKRFSDEELYEVRNRVPIKHVIEEVLKIPHRLGEDRRYKFSCPLCGCFETGINESNNLSRCFKCEKNFNSIDLVMQYGKKTFVDSVKILQEEIIKAIRTRDCLPKLLSNKLKNTLLICNSQEFTSHMLRT